MSDPRIAELERLLQERTDQLAQQQRELAEVHCQLEEIRRFETELLARLSHDLRTPVNAILGYARILQRKLQGQIDERQCQNLENIQTSAHRLLDLIDDLLNLSKVEASCLQFPKEER